MNIKQLILEKIHKNGSVKVSELVQETGLSRVYIHRFLKDLQNEGSIVLVGKANNAKYVLVGKEEIKKAQKEITKINLSLENKGLNEDLVLDKIKKETGIFFNLDNNTEQILDYAFMEMLNNAIEHSRSKTIRVTMQRSGEKVIFNVFDAGIGIFNSIKVKKKLKNVLEAMQDLLKGKETTAPVGHSGEGIFFTSKTADRMVIYGSSKKLVFDNKINDVFIRDSFARKGTRVYFEISNKSKRELRKAFDEYTGDTFEFEKTRVMVRLYKLGEDYISRSQARRITTELEKFKIVVLDFAQIKTIGQAFADEVFRVWHKKHPEINIVIENANDNVDFMIKHVGSR